MSFQNAVKFRYHSVLKLYGIYYAVIILANLILGAVDIKSGYPFQSGEWFMLSSAVFLFVIGFYTFKPSLQLMLQNGCSRQNVHYSFLAFMPVFLINAVLDYLFFMVRSTINLNYTNIEDYRPQIIYLIGIYSDESKLLANPAFDFIVPMAVYFMALALGYAVAMLFYRLNMFAKVLTAVSVSSVVILTLSILSVGNDDYFLPVSYLMSFFTGSYDGWSVHCNHFTAACVIVGLCALSVSHLLIRKIKVKK